MKTVIFIDGENLRYSLKNMGLRERDIHWTQFFQRCLEESDNLIRCYWYQAEKLIFSRVDNEKARRMVDQQNIKAGNKQAEIKRIMREATEWKDEETKKYKKKQDFFNHLSEKFSKIEMVRKGVLKMDPCKEGKERYLGEKGLDVALAIGMVKLCKNYEKVILISGDLDYAEAIQYVKDESSIVHIVRLFRGDPPKNRSVAKQLLSLADDIIDIHESEIRDTMLL